MTKAVTKGATALPEWFLHKNPTQNKTKQNKTPPPKNKTKPKTEKNPQQTNKQALIFLISYLISRKNFYF